ncbi:MAG: response regulator transcription factor [Oscillospiraceae bacterium]|nr:response regulator transcription factor [Oscillospiraceae bacterium]
MQHILLIEDDPELAGYLTDFLRDEGYAVTHALGQTDGLKAFRAGQFDCLLLDLSLQDGNGFSICAAIRQESDIPVLFLTASADEACTVTGLELGADDYIGKPFRPRELIARMKNAMRKHSRKSSLLTLGSIRLDPERGTVSKDGAELILSALEYRLLLIFMTNKGQLLTRERLIDELWSASGEFVSDNTLTVYIKRLRERIEQDAQAPHLILTVRGMGYKAVDG